MDAGTAAFNLPGAAQPVPAVVFNTDGREIPIVHRIIKVHQRANDSSSVDILTKVGRSLAISVRC